MLAAISPLTLGAAATALAGVARAAPTPGEFFSALQKAVGGGTAEKTPAAEVGTAARANAKRSPDLRSMLHRIEQSLGSLFAGESFAGDKFDTSQPMTIDLGESGDIRVSGHPQAERIETAIAADRELTRLIGASILALGASPHSQFQSTGGSSRPALIFQDGRLTPSA